MMSGDGVAIRFVVSVARLGDVFVELPCAEVTSHVPNFPAGFALDKKTFVAMPSVCR